MNSCFVKMATPEFLTKLMQSIGMQGEAPPAPPKKPNFNPTGLEDIGVGAGIGGLAGGVGAAVPGGMAMFKEKRLSNIPGEDRVVRDAAAAAIQDMLGGKGDTKTKAMYLQSILKDADRQVGDLAHETSELKRSIPSLIKYRNMAMKLGIPAGLIGGGLAGLGYYSQRKPE